jgi:hypothetical protein
MNPIPKLLSKTKLMRGYRCLKCIYLTVHHPELEAPITPDLQALFDQGNEVGAKAREYFPGGVLIDNKPWDFTGALHKTRELIANGASVIYEAAFEFAGCYARADIIQYSPDTKRWKIFEVKSSTKVKPEQLDDVGLQAWIMAKSGLPIEQINIVHLNNEFRYPDLTNLFTIVDVTEQIREQYLNIQPKVRDILTTIRQPDIPNIDIGSYCNDPTECGFVEHCWQQKNIPETSVFNLPSIRDKKWDLYYDGIINLDDPRLTDLNPLQERVVQCYLSNTRYVDAAAIQEAMTEWQYPYVFLDFETINPAIPRYDGTRPFEQVPFQFSVHVQASPDSPIVHHEFLHDNADDPRPTLIPELLKACGETGSIIAYFGRFESERIAGLADFSPAHRDALLALNARIVDPLPIIRDAVYDNKFNGSFSLKKVAPALLGEAHSYDDMDVANGSDAQRAFMELISPNISNTKKAQIKKAMLDYCRKDTEVMVELVKWLKESTMHHS